jgi:hypothetical protein
MRLGQGALFREHALNYLTPDAETAAKPLASLPCVNPDPLFITSQGKSLTTWGLGLGKFDFAADSTGRPIVMRGADDGEGVFGLDESRPDASRRTGPPRGVVPPIHPRYGKRTADRADRLLRCFAACHS